MLSEVKVNISFKEYNNPFLKKLVLKFGTDFQNQISILKTRTKNRFLFIILSGLF
jgi:hypothetical protein